MRILIAATSNENKLRHYRTYFPSIFSIDEFCKKYGLDYAVPAETGKNYADNSLLKCRAIFDSLPKNFSNCTIIADDSGLEIREIDGFPGINSDRWMKECGGKDMALAKLSTMVKSGAKARFIAVVTILKYPEGKIIQSEGVVNGKLEFPGRGDKHLAYDSIFIPDGSVKTSAEMTFEDKIKYSSRIDALSKLPIDIILD